MFYHQYAREEWHSSAQGDTRGSLIGHADDVQLKPEVLECEVSLITRKMHSYRVRVW